MNVAITAQGDTPEAALDPRFGRAAWFIIMDTETGEHRAIDNAQNLNAAQGAGIQAAQNVAAQSVDALISGHCGPKAFRTLAAANIKVYVGGSGTVRNAFESFTRGELREAAAADVEGHW